MNANFLENAMAKTNCMFIIYLYDLAHEIILKYEVRLPIKPWLDMRLSHFVDEFEFAAPRILG